jgi:phage terminase large subunit
MFEMTTAVKKMLRMSGRKKVIQGATSSGKTYGIIPILIDKCIATPRLKCTVVAESIPAVKDGAVQIFQDFMHNEGRWNDNQWIGNPMQYTFLNGSIMQFKSFDSYGKAKAAGKRDLLFINEANHIDKEIADALIIRSKECWFDFNADREFWAHTDILNQPSSEFLKLTYLDNESIPSETLEDLLWRKQLAEAEEKRGEKGYWWNWCQVYLYGEIGSLQGAIFQNWTTADLPKEARLLYFGCDFGFATSKAAIIGIYNFNNTMYLKEFVYETQLTNQKLAEKFKQNGYKSGTVYCDSAEPKSIQELRDCGINAVPCDSKQDIKKFAIQKLNEKEFVVSSCSTNLINELRYYVYDEKTGKPKKTDNDHLMDEMLYAIGSDGKYNGKY